ncbi:MAG: DUF2384 domain-containing protein [Alphaproteobacteria bacterium]|nr:DUF2384 domain-containing protein [Alphaproteobacteria bacterium]
MNLQTPSNASRPQKGAVLTKAVLQATVRLELSAKALAAIIGVSEATVSRMRRAEFTLEEGTKPFELAVLFIRLFRSLDAIVGGDQAVACSWLRNTNNVLNGRPIDQILTIAGLTDVITYLDSRRAIV